MERVFGGSYLVQPHKVLLLLLLLLLRSSDLDFIFSCLYHHLFLLYDSGLINQS
jgi:hypothetical protein